MLQVYGAAPIEHVLQLPETATRDGNRDIQIISSAASVVFITYRDSHFHTNNLLNFLALDMDLIGKPMQAIKGFQAKMPHNPHSFIRQTASEAVYGYLSPTLNGRHGHRQWIFESWKFFKKNIRRTLPILETHPGNDIGSSVIFEILGEDFFVISNQDTLTSEERNPESHYYVSRYSLSDEGLERPQSWKLWRRNHREGPIDDNWTNLRLEKDERTGHLIITETRKEWVEKLRKFKRTHYSQDLWKGAIFAEEQDGCNSEANSVKSLEVDENYGTPPLDPIRALENGLKTYHSRRSEPKLQVPAEKTRHSEYQGGDPPPGYRDFLSSRTQYSAYIMSSKAYCDLVIDDTFANAVRVRIQSWKKNVYSICPNSFSAKTCTHPFPTEDSGKKACYVDTSTRLWPPTDAPCELLHMLNPTTYTHGMKFRAVSDERSIIYMAERQQGERHATNPIILINFDPAIRFKGLPQLGEPWPLNDGPYGLAPTCRAFDIGAQVRERPRQKFTCRKAPAAWTSIRRGFNLR